MQQNKNNRQRLGLDVELTSEPAELDLEAQNVLRNIARGLQSKLKGPHKHVCSFATHIYLYDGDLQTGDAVSVLHQVTAPGDPSEQLVSMATADLARHLMSTMFGRKVPSTLDKLDKREGVNGKTVQK